MGSPWRTNASENITAVANAIFTPSFIREADCIGGKSSLRSTRQPRTDFCTRSELAEKFHYPTLRPAAIVAIRLRQEGAVAAILGLDENDVGIGKNPLPRFWKNADKWIVGCVQDQRGHSNVVDDVGSG